jgi:hypothetical protein
VEAYFERPPKEGNVNESKAEIIPQGSDSFKVLNTRNLTKKQRDLMAKQVGMGEAVVSLGMCSPSDKSSSESPEPKKMSPKSKKASTEPKEPVPEAPAVELQEEPKQQDDEAKEMEVNINLEQPAKIDTGLEEKEAEEANPTKVASKRKNKPEPSKKVTFENKVSVQKPEHEATKNKTRAKSKQIDKDLHIKLDITAKDVKKAANSPKKEATKNKADNKKRSLRNSLNDKQTDREHQKKCSKRGLAFCSERKETSYWSSQNSSPLRYLFQL